MLTQIKSKIRDSITVKEQVIQDDALLSELQTLIEACIASLKDGGKIIFCGNGGSFADAQHLSAEFTARFERERSSLASVALGTNSSTLSAIGNDYGYEYVFSRELESIGQDKDIFIAISTSGNSRNVVEAVKVANAKGIKTWGWTGQGAGKMADMCDTLRMPSSNTARIQECHIMLGHILCGAVEELYFN
tara:strand:- start:55 stop:627 length:573 start_codon:yes stop_codon:yes gene_type:complete